MKNHRSLLTFSLEECRPGRTHLLLAALADPAAVVPLIAIKGESAGPLFIAVAGVHGDEFEGPQAIWEIARDLPPSSLRGTLLALPVCNPWAFAVGQRSTPDAIDGRNLAREFPGAADGAPTQRLGLRACDEAGVVSGLAQWWNSIHVPARRGIPAWPGR